MNKIEGNCLGGSKFAHLVRILHFRWCKVERVAVVTAITCGPITALTDVSTVRRGRPARAPTTTTTVTVTIISTCITGFTRIVRGHTTKTGPRKHAVSIRRRWWSHWKRFLTATSNSGSCSVFGASRFIRQDGPATKTIERRRRPRGHHMVVACACGWSGAKVRVEETLHIRERTWSGRAWHWAESNGGRRTWRTG